MTSSTSNAGPVIRDGGGAPLVEIAGTDIRWRRPNPDTPNVSPPDDTITPERVTPR